MKIIKIIKNLLVIFSLALGLSVSAVSSEELQSLADKAVLKYKLPGLVLGELQEGTLVNVASGARANGNPTEVTVDDQFHIGSCFKAITATLVARYVEKGKIGWDTTIEEVFGDSVAEINSDIKDVTVEELLAHRGGIDDASLAKKLYDQVPELVGSTREIRTQLLPQILGSKQTVKRGDFVYSNFGYTIVGAMLEKITSKDFEDLIQEEVFTPLAMDTAIFGSPGLGKPANDFSFPRKHNKFGKPLLPSQPLKRIKANALLSLAGGFTSMAMLDWSKFIQANFTGKDASAANYLSQDSVTKLHSAYGETIQSNVSGSYSYGYGWGILKLTNGETVFNHSGSDGFWLSQVFRRDSDGHTFLALTNIANRKASRAFAFIAKNLDLQDKFF
jgi:CubicO group peptidase (beta-lactamase class C family)